MLYLLVRLLPAITHLIVSLVLFRQTEPQVYLGYAYTIALMMGLGIASSAWLIQSLVRDNHAFQEPSTASPVIWLGVGTILLASGPVAYLMHQSVLAQHAVNFTSTALFFSSWVLFLNFFYWHIGQNKPSILLKSELTRSSISIALAIVLVLCFDLQSANTLILVSSFTTAASTVLLAPRATCQLPTKHQCHLLWSALKHNWQAIIWFLASTVLFWSDRIALEAHVSPKILAIYVLVSDLIQRGTQFVYGSIVVSLQPHIANQLHNSIENTMRVVRVGIAMQVALTAGLTVGVYLLAPPILNVAIGSSASTAVELVWPLLWAYACWQAAQILQKPLEYGGWLGFVSGAACLTCVVVYTLATFMLSIYGYKAGAFALAIGCTTYTITILAALITWRYRSAPK